MNQRRSLSQALQTVELPAEALALIREGSPRAVDSRTPRLPKIAGDFCPVPELAPRPVSVEEPARPESDPELLPPRGLVSLSVRVKASLADTLLKVAFERKLQRKQPYSQQDIVIQAVGQWLRKNGYVIPE